VPTSCEGNYRQGSRTVAMKAFPRAIHRFTG
jgi:hypothetical protein